MNQAAMKPTSLTSASTAITSALAGVVFIAIALAAPADADAKPGAPACDAKFLPFYKGQVFEYEWLAPEVIAADDEAPPRRGPQADWPVNLKITVKDVSGGKSAATITLVETYRKRSVETTITCSDRGFRIDPQSFFFTGEAGGAVGMKLTNVKQDESGLPSARDFRPGLEWTSYITAGVERTATEGSASPTVTNGKIEIDRTLVLRGKELVETGMGEQRAFRLDVELSGRAAVEPALDKWRELPPAVVSMWFAPGKGLVRVHNRYGHGWQIKSITLPE